MKTNMKLTIMMVTILSLLLITEASAVSYTYDSEDVPKVIPDRSFKDGQATSVLEVPDSFEIADVDVVLDIAHTFNSNLEVFLIAPDGTQVELFTDVGRDTNNFKGTILDDEASKSIKDGSGPFTGSFKPEKKLSKLDGKDAQGTWKLKVEDDQTVDVGTLKSWGLVIESTEPLPPPPPPPPAESGGKTYESKDVPLDIKDPGTTASALDIPDAYTIADVNVALSIVHPYLEDLSAKLVAPDGTSVALFTNIGNGGSDFKDTVLNDEAGIPIADGEVPFMGIFQPEGSLSDFDGLNAKGTWLLEITDDSKLDVGTLICWSLTIDYVPVPICQDVTVPAQKNLQAEVGLVDLGCNGSFDPDGDEITVVLDPEGPYAIGETEVTLTVTDESDATDSCTAIVTVVPTTYSLREEAIGVLESLANPDDPNDPVQQALDLVQATLGDGVFWASPERIADAQRGIGGADVFANEQAACDLLAGVSDPNDPNVAEAVAEALDLLVTADQAVMDAVLSAAAFQGGDVAKAKAARCQGNSALDAGDTCTAIAKYAEAWQAAADELWLPPVETEIDVVPTPMLDYDQDGDVDMDDVWAFTDDILDILLPPEEEPK
jgi:subtilisin-like proprotein convertase family protein